MNKSMSLASLFFLNFLSYQARAVPVILYKSIVSPQKIFSAKYMPVGVKTYIDQQLQNAHFHGFYVYGFGDHYILAELSEKKIGISKVRLNLTKTDEVKEIIRNYQDKENELGAFQLNT